MKTIYFFCIPAHGHTNPMLAVAKTLVKRGNKVRFYSFDEFSEKIKATGAEFISCDRFLPEVSKEEETRLKEVSATEMSIQSIRTTALMDKFIEEEVKAFKPDVIYTDSVCFWGKLTAIKYNLPMVVSTSTFAFNQFSTQYMERSPKETADMVFGLPKISKELKTIEKYGYKVKSALSLVASDNNTDTIVYTSADFQPYFKSFSEHYNFVGPSLQTDLKPSKNTQRPLVYISLGTIMNERPDFYSKCIESLKNEDVDVIVSCGKTLDISTLGKIPENFSFYPSVNQVEVLSKASVFITHCGMNSVSESLYMATPMVLYPQTSEQKAVARRVSEKGAGVYLKNDDILSCVREILGNKKYADSAKACCDKLRACGGTESAAEFIENAPHECSGSNEYCDKVNIKNGQVQLVYWLIFAVVMVLFGVFVTPKYLWLIGLIFGNLNGVITGAIRKKYVEEILGD